MIGCEIFGQAKKPKLMCVPSRSWCVKNNFMDDFKDASGNIQKIPNYQKAFDENTDVSMVISAMQDFMSKENYQVTDLSAQLAKLKNRSARDNMTTAGGGISSSPIDELNKSAKCDIIVEVYYDIKREGPYKYVEFNVTAIDAYTSAPVSSGNIGRGTAASSAQLVNQLEEAVLSFKDKFISDMDLYYNRLFENGRQIIVRCTKAEASPVDFEQEYDGEELSQLIENWVSEKAMKGNYSLDNKTENEVLLTVNIPMTYTDNNGNIKGTDANWFCSMLRKYIEGTTGGVKCKLDLVGLGEVNLIMGGK